MDVTEDNLISYIHAMADYKLNAQIAQQTRAFLSGYYEVIKPEWLRSALFLQALPPTIFR